MNVTIIQMSLYEVSKQSFYTLQPMVKNECFKNELMTENFD